MAVENLLKESSFEEVYISVGDVSEAEFDDLSLEKAFLEDVIFNQAKISDFNTIDSIFSKCSFAGTFVERSYFLRTEFQSTRLQGIQLAQSRIIDTSFLSSKLNDANFRYAKLKNVLFESCDLSGSDLIRADLKNVVFKKCNLDGINFSHAQLNNVDLSGSNISNMIIGPEAIKEVYVDTEQALYLSSIFGLKIRD